MSKVLVVICWLLFNQDAFADEVRLDHHGRWVTAALLTEVLHQEQATIKSLKLKQPVHLGAQIYFTNQLASKIQYAPTVPQHTKKLAPKKIKIALSKLPHWQAWEFLTEPESRLVPLCRKQSSSIECQSFRAVQMQSEAQTNVIDQLHKMALAKPKRYRQTNIQSYHALLLLRQRQYAESLRVLFDLQANDRKFKLVYNKIQRIFSLSQKAQGEVVLRQTL